MSAAATSTALVVHPTLGIAAFTEDETSSSACAGTGPRTGPPAGLVVSVEKETAALRTLNRNDFEPWYASNPSFKPPPGKAGHFTTDTEKQGVDSRKWRSIEWYDVINGRRRKMGDEWAPLDDRGKLIKPPGGKFMIPTAAAKARIEQAAKKAEAVRAKAAARGVAAASGPSASNACVFDAPSLLSSSSQPAGPADGPHSFRGGNGNPVGRPATSHLRLPNPNDGRGVVLRALLSGCCTLAEVVRFVAATSSFGTGRSEATGGVTAAVRGVFYQERKRHVRYFDFNPYRGGECECVLTVAGEALRGADGFIVANDACAYASSSSLLANEPPLGEEAGCDDDEDPEVMEVGDAYASSSSLLANEPPLGEEAGCDDDEDPEVMEVGDAEASDWADMEIRRSKEAVYGGGGGGGGRGGGGGGGPFADGQ